MDEECGLQESSLGLVKVVISRDLRNASRENEEVCSLEDNLLQIEDCFRKVDSQVIPKE